MTNVKHIHTTIVGTYLNNRQHNKVTNTIPRQVHYSETTLHPPSNPSYPDPSQNKQMFSTMLIFKQNRRSQPPLCPLCISEPHTTTHLFNWTNINTQLQVTDLWTAPGEVGHLLVEWRGSPVDQRARIPVRWGDTIGRYA